MSDERTKRVARNHAMYRQVNERLEDVNEAFWRDLHGADEALVRVLRLLNQPHAQGAVLAGVGSLRPSPKAAARALLDLRHIERGR